MPFLPRITSILWFSFFISWEQRKVGELLEERDVKAPKSREYPLMAFIANEGVAPKGDRYDRSALVNDTENKPYKQTELGDFIYSSNNLETGSIGLNKYGKASISPVYSIFYPTGLADSDFLGRRLVRKDFINEMVKWRQGVIYGQWRIHESDFIKIEVAVPCVEEQRKIGRLLDSIDNLITLHQRKQNGRFVLILGENSSLILPIDWEQRKLGSIVYRASEMSETDDLPRVEYEDIDAGQGSLNKDLKEKVSTKKGIMFQSGDVLYGKLRPYLKNWLFAWFSGVAVGDFWVLRSNQVSQSFIYRLVQTPAFEYIANQSTGSKMPRADWNLVSNTTFAFPTSNEEQEAIGQIFLKLDNLITLHQCKEKSHIAHADKKVMFHTSLKLANDWEQRKLGDYFDERNERSGEGELISVTINSGIKKFNELGRFDTKPEDLSKYKRVEVGDIAYNSMRMWQGASGYSPYSGILSPAYTVISPKTGVSSLFFAYLIKRPQMIHLFEINSQGLTSDTWNLKFPAFSQIDASAPSDIDEQENIARLFMVLDNLITLHQRKQQEYELRKSSSILSTDKRINPLSWEQRKLGEVARSFEYGLNAAAKEYDGLNKYLRITDIDDVSRKFDTDNLTSPDTDLVTAENYRLVDGDILFARTGASVGKSYIYRASDGLVYFAGFLIRAKIKPEYDAEFVFQNTLSESYQTYILITSQRSGQPGVNAQEYSDYTFYLPTYDEQQKIGAFLCNLDNLITLHQRGEIIYKRRQT